MIGGPLRALVDGALVTVQAALEPATFAEAFAAGQVMTLEQGIAAILTATVCREPSNEAIG